MRIQDCSRDSESPRLGNAGRLVDILSEQEKEPRKNSPAKERKCNANFILQSFVATDRDFDGVREITIRGIYCKQALICIEVFDDSIFNY